MSGRTGALTAATACLIALSSLLAIPAFAAQAETDPPVIEPGISLRPVPDAEGLFVYRRSERPLSGYRQFLIEPIGIRLAVERDEAGGSDDLQRAIARIFREETVRRLDSSARYSVVELPGAGVARVRAALTDVPDLAAEQASAANRRSDELVRLLLLAPGLRRVGLTVEVRDSTTDQLLFAWVDRKAGERFVRHRARKSAAESGIPYRGYARSLRRLLGKDDAR